MSVLVYIDHTDGEIKKSSLEAASYGAQLASQLGVAAHGLVLGTLNADLSALGKQGLQKVHQVKNDSLNQFDPGQQAVMVAEAVTSLAATVVVVSNNVTGKALGPRLSARLKAGLVAGAVALPDTSNSFVVKKAVFSGKAFAQVAVSSPIKIIALTPNAFSVSNGDGSAEVADINLTVPAAKIKVTGTNKIKGQIPLSEAELVVSGGRGLKGPENWGMIEELADLLGAATACSRPVADSHWRPHHEHVGQTGGAVAPNLYFAVGISGAIQHLAGVNRSKVIVVINKDPEAPFFKAADYGIVGDAFEVMPKIIDSVKKLKGK
ncbi:electron transfer flavoprotein subunit alpha/FixB family protein [Flavihumibacter cheonanensis]|uniref:electron transfer flavoprotein subunit alpha/FixB family protein n=1 Tax=Flavihumibacter cheonanensis TaxID=1442385 RepID=UPI001EF97BF0|nr:electron transfer flavoprotein subunit alpha/FixB family protein [Flavihumibacter cheonanensis]MCG7751701.1 electron transfer flavoprotein subunit alpha/FixB family protein [Flavihumibacter cheonanensis]